MYTIFINMKLHTLPLLWVVAFASCSTGKSESSSKNAIQEYGIVSKQDVNLADCLSQIEEKYLIFFYSETCGHCKEIIEDVTLFAESNIIKTYFLNISKNENKIERCSHDEIEIGIDSVEDLKIVGTPTIVEVENGVTTANVVGKDSILSFLNSKKINISLHRRAFLW